jgi:O-acetyl-ADP-ribose deacetylase (regulator of RNase III)
LAFPSIGTGAYGYPIEEASQIAVETALSQLQRFPSMEKVVFVVFSPKDLEVYKRRLGMR